MALQCIVHPITIVEAPYYIIICISTPPQPVRMQTTIVWSLSINETNGHTHTLTHTELKTYDLRI